MKRNKRVAMISVHECPLASSEGKERGGINVYVYELSKALSRIGWQVDAFTRVQDDIHPRIVSVNENFRVIHLPNGPHTTLSKREILDSLPEFIQGLTDFIKHEGLPYDAIHSHYYLSGIVASDLNKTISKKIPTVMTFHTLGLMKQLVARSMDTEDPVERIPLERNLISHMDKFITSSDIGKEYLSTFYDCPEEKILTIPPGVDTALFRPIDQLEAKKHIHADPNDHIVLAVGRIDPVKGFDVLLVALKTLLKREPTLSGKVCLWIVGGDIEQNQNSWSRELKKLNSLRQLLNLTTTVQFVPPQPQEELPYYYNAADVLVMPSHYESFGMVALEAISCGTPVIATDVTGISPILKEFPGSHVVSANNPLALADEIGHVLKTAHRIPTKPNAISAFSWQEIAGRIAQEYTRLSP